MTDPTNPGCWPDGAREAVEWNLAAHFSGNRMPHMSGDPRARLNPGTKRRMDDAIDSALAALAPYLAAALAEARRAGMREAVVYLKGSAAAAAWMKDILAAAEGTP